MAKNALCHQITVDFIEAVILNDTTKIANLNPGYAKSSIRQIQTMARSYKLNPEKFLKKYHFQSKTLLNYIIRFVDEYKDFVPTRFVCDKKVIRAQKQKAPIKVDTAFIESRPKQEEQVPNKIEAKEVLNLLAATIKTIQLLIEKMWV